MTLRVLLAGGGTGGHVFPLLSVAESLRALHPDVDITFVGTSRGMEATLLPARGEKLELLDCLPLKGKTIGETMRGVLKAFTGLPAARALVKKISPDVCLSIGGYAAGTASVAAWSLGVPVGLMEPNAVLGLSNKLLSPFVSRAYLVFPEASKGFRPSVVRNLGMPIRQVFQPVPYQAGSNAPKLVVLGGSQGAAHLNTTIPQAFSQVIKSFPDATILHQAGRDRDSAVRADYEKFGCAANATVVPFVDDVAGIIASADIVLARAGAGSVAEICTVGRPVVFVPFPFAADDHQRRNAESLANAGAAICVRQNDASADRLASEIIALLSDPARREKMAHEAAARGSAGASIRIAQDLLTLARRSKHLPLATEQLQREGALGSNHVSRTRSPRSLCGHWRYWDERARRNIVQPRIRRKRL